MSDFFMTDFPLAVLLGHPMKFPGLYVSPGSAVPVVARNHRECKIVTSFSAVSSKGSSMTLSNAGFAARQTSLPREFFGKHDGRHGAGDAGRLADAVDDHVHPGRRVGFHHRD